MPIGLFVSGGRIPASGVYEVRHTEHNLPREVTLLRGQQFPRCERCSQVVRFRIIRVINALDEMNDRIVLHVLPVIDGDGGKAAA